MKQYKHISGIIGELKEDGFLHFERGDSETCCRESIWKGFIENSSDWQEVRPKEYQILSVIEKFGSIFTIRQDGRFWCNDIFVELDKFGENFKIHSVKRLSDGEVFCVGDKVKYPFGGYPSEIKKIILVNKEDEDVVATISEGSLGKIALCVDRYVGNLLLENAVKILNPVLFTTEDGVQIRQGEKFYVVDEKYGKFKMHETIGGHFTKEHKERKRFASKEVAEEYVLMNSPCLSVNYVINANSYNYSLRKELVELAKSKIKNQ